MLKEQTQASYAQRLGRVIDYVHAHLDDDLSFDRLAEIACLSAYHWSRIYSAMYGETIAATIRRLRLQRAADRLANSALDISEIAAQAGYGSSDTFGRAFKDAFGMAPATYRETGSHAAFKAANAAADATGFPVTIEHRAPQRCAGIDHTGSYMHIDQAMGRLFAELSVRQSLPAQPAMIGIFYDDPALVPTDALRSRACIPVGKAASITPPLVETVFHGGLYARLSYTGPYADMSGAYRWLLGIWLPASGHDPAEAPIFEAYLNDPRQVPQSQLRTDIHLPLAPSP